MGACVGTKKEHTHNEDDLKKLRKIVNDKQLYLLHMIYQDLAMRISENELSMQNFLLFFHKNGYWGDRLFHQFDANASNLISEQEFIKGIIKTFKTSDEQKIELLYKFFSNNRIVQGISFPSFLTMLYNYPKEDFQEILNDPQFINEELKKNLIGIDTGIQNRRLLSVCPNDMLSNKIAGAKFRFHDNSENHSDRLESKAGTTILNEMNEVINNKNAFCLKLKVGQNDIEVKTTSLHHLVKKFAKTIFKKYHIDEKQGKLEFESFRDWIKNHPKLFENYYNGFHKEAWEIDRNTNKPLYLAAKHQMTSKAKLLMDDSKMKKVIVYLLNSVLIFCEETDLESPILIVCLEGLSVKDNFDKNLGDYIEITHRDDIYPVRKFYLINKDLQKQWMENLKFFQGNSITSIYEMGQKIGLGKFSVVYSCKEKDTQEEYALKVIETFKLDEDARKLIAHESSIMSILSHPLLVFFKESIQTKTHIYIITELVKGKDMFEFVRDFKYLDQNEAAYIVQQIIIGVKYIHSLGIVHRDLKPENIMLQYDEPTNKIGTVKIIDFGFANYLSKLREVPPEELFAGTPNYIAPEILKGEPISQKIDNFAIGAIMYFAISGTLPFNSMDIGTILQKTLEGSYIVKGGRWKQVSQDCIMLIEKLLETDPEQRITLDEALKHKWFDRARNSETMKSLVMGNRKTAKLSEKRIF